MGLLSRLKAVSTGKLLAFLDQADDPERTLAQLLPEMEGQLTALRQAEAKSLTAVRADQRRLEETLGRALRLERGAELALKKGEAETAREALRAQLRVEAQLPPLQHQVERTQQVLDEVRERRAILREQMVLLKNKRAQLSTRTQIARPVLCTTAEPMLERIARMEERTLLEAAALEVRREVAQQVRKRSLDERLLALERENEIETRLQQMKQGEERQDHDG